jgi:biotin carboxyl carrier protein
MKYHIKIGDQIYEVEIVDLHAHPIVALVDGERYEIEPQNGQSRPSPIAVAPALVTQAPPVNTQPAPGVTPTSATPGTGTLVRAPIPGVIVALLVRPEDNVTHGQELCTIEAMKMRNNIRASRAGRVPEILVTTGQTVNHNDPLIRFEEQV